jgi:hypothetical protein
VSAGFALSEHRIGCLAPEASTDRRSFEALGPERKGRAASETRSTSGKWRGLRINTELDSNDLIEGKVYRHLQLLVLAVERQGHVETGRAHIGQCFDSDESLK